MRLNLLLAVSVLSLSASVSACAGSPEPSSPPTEAQTIEIPTSVPGLSAAASATAVLDENRMPVGVSAYPAPVDAVKAGDTAAFLLMTKDLNAEDRAANPLFDAFLAIDRAADGDTAGARDALNFGTGNDYAETESGFYVFLDAWLLAMDGDST